MRLVLLKKKKKKFTELQNKIPDVSSLATKRALNAVENNT